MDQLVNLEIIESLREVGDSRDSDFTKSLFDLFTQQSEMVVREMGAALERRDIERVTYYSHRLKGSAANIGATALSRHAEGIESMSKAGMLNDDLRRAVASLSPLREETLLALDKYLVASPQASGAD